MTRLGIGICVLILAACYACTSDNKAPLADKQIEAAVPPAQGTHTRVQIEPVGEIPNNGLQLPVVSTDGEWIAYLDFHSDQPIDLEALFTGRGLQSMSLKIQSLTAGGSVRTICDSGAAWPAWSSDSKRLVFIAYDGFGQCKLGIYDLPTATARLVSISHKHAIMPAVSPSGRQVAIVAPGDVAESFRLHVVDSDTGKLIRTCPTDLPASKQLWPQWASDGRIIFVHAQGPRSWLAQWLPGGFPPDRICEIRIPDSQPAIFQSLAGLPGSLSPDDAHFAYYDTAADRVVLIRLRDSRRTQLPTAIRAGCWLDSQRFAAADDNELRLFSISSAPSALLTHGLWLPRSSSSANGVSSLVLCTPGRHPRMFSLVRMRVLVAE